MIRTMFVLHTVNTAMSVRAIFLTLAGLALVPESCNGFALSTHCSLVKLHTSNAVLGGCVLPSRRRFVNGLLGQGGSGRRSGVASLRAQYVPDAEDVASSQKDPDHPVLKDPAIITCRTSGEKVRVYSHGACVTSYMTPSWDVFFVRPDAVLDGSKPISGGVPFCFPQFGPGDIQQHGFMRNVKWTMVDWREEAAQGSRGLSFLRDTARIVYEVFDTKYTFDMWPRKFFARYSVDLSAGSLLLDFRVKNLDFKSFDFTAALHTYYAVRDIDTAEIRGNFKGLKYLDKIAGEEKVEDRDVITIREVTDRVYYGMKGTVELIDGERSVRITPQGEEWQDLVLWNPYGDEKMGYKNFVCIENAVVGTPTVVAPGEWWCSAVQIEPCVDGMPAFVTNL